MGGRLMINDVYNTRILELAADIPRLRKLWEGRVKPMFNDKTFKATPNSRCTYCHYRANNDGPCKY